MASSPEPKVITKVHSLHDAASAHHSLQDDAASVFSATDFIMDDEINNTQAYRRVLAAFYKRSLQPKSTYLDEKKT